VTLAVIATAQSTLRLITARTLSHERSIFPPMSGDDPEVEELRRRQRQQEHLEREQIAGADSEADADAHRRRAEKAGYLRRKLEQRQQAEREADGDEPELPPAA
jgi:hypothetical protein